MYGTSVKNIFQVEAFFDMLITQEFSSQIRDPNFFQINRFHMKKIYSTPLSECLTLVDWSDSYLKNKTVTEALQKNPVLPVGPVVSAIKAQPAPGENEAGAGDLQMDVFRVHFARGLTFIPKP